jgi:hypothetical protein
MPDFPLPEFTRSLRALAVPSAPGSDHDRVFAPLLQARTSTQRVRTFEARIGAFDAARLERAWREAIAALAADRHPRSAPDRRALAAELEELAAPVWRALGALTRSAASARAAPLADREGAWEAWVASVQQVFNAADDWWRAALPVLGEPRGRRGAFWRRILGRGA